MNEGAVVAGILFLIIVVLAICLIPMVFFLIHLQKLLNKCSVNNRAMESGMVWLNLIPLFNLGWVFYTIFKVTESLKAEFKERNIDSEDPEFSHPIGLAYCITSACCIIPFINYLTGIASLVLFIIYWVKTHRYSKQLD